MLPALVSLKNLIKTKSYHIDLPFFRLHYQATVCLLLAFCLILTAKVLFGDTIDCDSHLFGKSDFQDNICFSIGTYSRYRINNETGAIDPRGRYIYPGLLVNNVQDQQLRILWHNYYQYIPIVLFIQAVMFYFPHYLWKLWENGMIASVCKRLHEHRFSPSDYLENNYEMINYLQNFFKFNRSLVYKYYFCHMLLLVNLIAQVLALDAIFNDQFVTYGYAYLNYLIFDTNPYGIRHISQKSSDALLPYRIRSLNNPMDFVFPKLTNCYIELSSKGGNNADDQAPICVLPLNILHDKFFLLLWFWFVFLGVATVLQMLYNLLYSLMPPFRKYVFIKSYGEYYLETFWGNSNARPSSLPEVFLLDLIGQNTDKFAFVALIRKLNKEDWTASPSENHSVV